MCEQCERREQADRLMWLAIRRGLLAVAAAIAKRYDVDRPTNPKQRGVA